MWGCSATPPQCLQQHGHTGHPQWIFQDYRDEWMLFRIRFLLLTTREKSCLEEIKYISIDIKWNKPVTERQKLHDCTSLRYQQQANSETEHGGVLVRAGGWVGVQLGMESLCLMDTAFRWGRWKEFCVLHFFFLNFTKNIFLYSRGNDCLLKCWIGNTMLSSNQLYFRIVSVKIYNKEKHPACI